MILRWNSHNGSAIDNHFLSVAYVTFTTDEIVFWTTAETGFKAGTESGRLKRKGLSEVRVYEGGALLGSIA